MSCPSFAWPGRLPCSPLVSGTASLTALPCRCGLECWQLFGLVAEDSAPATSRFETLSRIQGLTVCRSRLHRFPNPRPTYEGLREHASFDPSRGARRASRARLPAPGGSSSATMRFSMGRRSPVERPDRPRLHRRDAHRPRRRHASVGALRGRPPAAGPNDDRAGGGRVQPGFLAWRAPLRRLGAAAAPRSGAGRVRPDATRPGRGLHDSAHRRDGPGYGSGRASAVRPAARGGHLADCRDGRLRGGAGPERGPAHGLARAGDAGPVAVLAGGGAPSPERSLDGSVRSVAHACGNRGGSRSELLVSFDGDELAYESSSAETMVLLSSSD